MPDRAAERPFTETEAGISTGSDGMGLSGGAPRDDPSSQPPEAPRTDRLLPASTASGPVALPKPMEQERRHTAMIDCVCGGRFRVERRNPVTGINQHGTTRQHQDWRAAHEFNEHGMPR